MIQITLITERYELKPNTKNSYRLQDTTRETISESTLTNYINSVGFFRRLGGKERLEYSYTCYGFKPVKLTSVSPQREQKVIRYFTYQFLEN